MSLILYITTFLPKMRAIFAQRPEGFALQEHSNTIFRFSVSLSWQVWYSDLLKEGKSPMLLGQATLQKEV